MVEAQGFSRRRFLTSSAAGLAVASPLGRLLAAAGRHQRAIEGYGPLEPVADESTGLPLLRLPRGFRYVSYGWTGDRMRDRSRIPGSHDGMGVVAQRGSRLILVRNHEITRDTGSFAPRPHAWDRAAAGGTTSLEFDTARGRWLDAWPSLTGTITNCAGGVTPWGTWLSCEEYVHEPGSEAYPLTDQSAEDLPRLKRQHGYVFEVDPSGRGTPEPLYGLGQFRHEAAVVHPDSGIVYLTEDREPTAGFYRFVPKQKGKLAEGGRLEMLVAEGGADLRTGLTVGQRWRVRWVSIEDPDRGHTPGLRDGRGVLTQGIAAGASVFIRLEGCVVDGDRIYFAATNGGDAGAGQVFVLHQGRQELELWFESGGLDSIYYPDNICVSPRGALVVCEDGGRSGQQVFGLTADGGRFPIASNQVRLDGERNNHKGDFSSAEWAGVCFSPDGNWMFANIYAPGFTVAITGPWANGLA
jgi:secreted PhoX family phosphatase